MLLRSERTRQFQIITIGLSVMKKDGSDLRYVTDNPSEATQEHQPDWVLAPRLGPATAATLKAGPRATPPTGQRTHRRLRTPARSTRLESVHTLTASHLPTSERHPTPPTTSVSR